LPNLRGNGVYTQAVNGDSFDWCNGLCGKGNSFDD